MRTAFLKKLNTVGWLAMALLVETWAVAEPVLEVTKDREPGRPEKVFHVRYHVTWTGDPAEYVVMPVQYAEPIDWATVQTTVESVAGSDGTNSVTQIVEIVPAAEGNYTLPKGTIDVLSPEGFPTSIESEIPTHPTNPEIYPNLRVDPLTLQVRPYRPQTWLYGILGAIFVSILAAGALLMRRRRVVLPAIATVPAAPTPDSRLAQAKRGRIEGDFYTFYTELAAAVRQVAGPEDSLTRKLERCASEAGYSGRQPTADELDSDLRAVYHRLSEVNTDDASD